MKGRRDLEFSALQKQGVPKQELQQTPPTLAIASGKMGFMFYLLARRQVQSIRFARRFQQSLETDEGWRRPSEGFGTLRIHYGRVSAVG